MAGLPLPLAEFTAAVAELRPILVRYATSLVGQDAEDVVQLSLERVWRGTGQPVRDWRSWLMASVRNTGLNWLRARQSEQGRSYGEVASLEALQAPDEDEAAWEPAAWDYWTPSS